MEIGQKIKQLRQQKNLNQQDLADLVGATAVAISNYELGKHHPDHEKLKKLSKALGVTIGEFYDDHKKPMTPGSDTYIAAINTMTTVIEDEKRRYKEALERIARLEAENAELMDKLMKKIKK